MLVRLLSELQHPLDQQSWLAGDCFPGGHAVQLCYIKTYHTAALKAVTHQVFAATGLVGLVFYYMYHR